MTYATYDSYNEAVTAFRAASKAFRAVQADYRARKVTDDEYFAARALVYTASKAVDEAEDAIQAELNFLGATE